MAWVHGQTWNITLSDVATIDYVCALNEQGGPVLVDGRIGDGWPYTVPSQRPASPPRSNVPPAPLRQYTPYAPAL
jgi:hypothetical protein